MTDQGAGTVIDQGPRSLCCVSLSLGVRTRGQETLSCRQDVAASPQLWAPLQVMSTSLLACVTSPPWLRSVFGHRSWARRHVLPARTAYRLLLVARGGGIHKSWQPTTALLAAWLPVPGEFPSLFPIVPCPERVILEVVTLMASVHIRLPSPFLLLAWSVHSRTIISSKSINQIIIRTPRRRQEQHTNIHLRLQVGLPSPLQATHTCLTTTTTIVRYPPWSRYRAAPTDQT